MHNLHAQVMEFYIFKHFIPQRKVMLSYSFEFNLRNSTNEDMGTRDCSVRVKVTALLEYINLYNKFSRGPQ